jgi:hypothetical protein
MTNGKVLILVTVLVVKANGAVAQQAPTPSPVEAEPVLLTLPIGSQVRMQARTAPGQWMNGVLVSADAASVAFVPENAPPLGANQLRVPSASVTRFELKTGSKRHWLLGLGIGVAFGLVMGAVEDVDPVQCQYDDYTSCTRGEAIAIDALAGGLLGVGIGALVKTDRWTPVALDALAPPAPRASGVEPRLRLLPGGGVGLGVTIGF